MSDTLFMENTEIAEEKTVLQVQQLLVKHKAESVLLEYERGKIAAVAFHIRVRGALVPFRLPCRWQAVQLIFSRRNRDYVYWERRVKENPKELQWKTNLEIIAKKYEDKARRVAWRQILRWVEAQLALVATEMVKVEEVFLPYAQLAGGQTVFEMVENRGFMLENKQ